MRIVFIITGLGMGGAEKVVTSLADYLAQKGHEILIVFLTGGAVVHPSDSAIPVEDLQIKSLKDVIPAYFNLRKIVRNFSPDVVHSHMVHANLLARLIRLTTRIPRLICTAHSTNEGGKLRMWAYRLTDSLADISTNVSQEAVRALEAQGAVPRGRMLAVLNGIDCEKFSPDSAIRESTRQRFEVGSSKIAIAVGRLFEAKDYPNLLRAFAQVAEKNADVKLWIAGDGFLRDSLESLSNELGLTGRVLFLGMRHDIPDLMRAADIFVLSSAWEGFGLVVAEAMATEKVVVATDSGGVKEVVGDCGLLVPPTDFKALANAMQNALTLPADETKAIGQKARQRIIENYSLDKVVDKWIEIYKGERV